MLSNSRGLHLGIAKWRGRNAFFSIFIHCAQRCLAIFRAPVPNVTRPTVSSTASSFIFFFLITSAVCKWAPWRGLLFSWLATFQYCTNAHGEKDEQVRANDGQFWWLKLDNWEFNKNAVLKFGRARARFESAIILKSRRNKRWEKNAQIVRDVSSFRIHGLFVDYVWSAFKIKRPFLNDILANCTMRTMNARKI